MNEIIALIKARRTAHIYHADPVPEALIEAALECAIRAPNHKLTNPWRFTRIGPQTRAAIVELAVQIKEADGPMSEARRDKVREKMASSPELFVVTQILADDAFRRREDYAACACAIQNFALALWSEGVGSKWSTGGITSHPHTYELAAIDPDAEEIIGFIWVGYADPQPETPRLPRDMIVSRRP